MTFAGEDTCIDLVLAGIATVTHTHIIELLGGSFKNFGWVQFLTGEDKTKTNNLARALQPIQQKTTQSSRVNASWFCLGSSN
jgi:hypothetical protein